MKLSKLEKTITETQFEQIERTESMMYGITIFATYVTISAIGSLFLMWVEDLI